MSQKTFFTMDSKLTFGTKHKGRTVREVVDSDPGWIVWAIKKVDWAQFDMEVYQAVGEPCDSVPAVPSVPTSLDQMTKMNMEILEDMINATVVLAAGIVEHPSLGYMIVVPMDDPSVLGHIQRHLVEIQTTLRNGSSFVLSALPLEQKPVATPTTSTNFAAGDIPGDDLPF